MIYISILIGFILLLLSVFVIFFSYYKIRYKNLLLKSQKDEIEKKNEELKLRNDEILSKRDEITLRGDLIKEQKENIKDSLYYAKRIQRALLPTKEYAKQILGEHFILYRPNDIVSGDFYWVRKLKDTILIAVADCTGHGAVGAFMSILGITVLNDIINRISIDKSNEIKASEILAQLREMVLISLYQREQEDVYSASDINMEKIIVGMDIALCLINQKTKLCRFAGANNPLFIIKAEPFDEEFPLQEIKSDKMSISLHVKMENFNNIDIRLSSGDCIYLFSNGFPDQAGGSSGKKFSYKSFRQLIVKSYNLSMAEQEKLIEKTLNEWMNPQPGNKYKQTDDITIMGIRI